MFLYSLRLNKFKIKTILFAREKIQPCFIGPTSPLQAAKMYFLQKVAGLFLLDKVQSTEICQFVNIERPLLSIERLQLRLFGYVKRMSRKQTANGCFVVYQRLGCKHKCKTVWSFRCLPVLSKTFFLHILVYFSF